MRPARLFIATGLVLGIAAACTSDTQERASTNPDIRPSGPLLPTPAGLWQPPAGSTPATGSYAYVDMDASYSAGVTYPHTIASTTGPFSVTWKDGRLSATATDTIVKRSMSTVFQTMLGVTELKLGYYGGLHGLSDADPLVGALSVSLNARECAVLNGWFAVDHAFYFNGKLTQVDLRFEARCAGFTTPMHGLIHWREADS